MNGTIEKLPGRTEADSIAELAPPSFGTVGSHRFALAHERQRVIDLDRFAAAPTRLAGVTDVDDLDSFISLVNARRTQIDTAAPEIFWRADERHAQFAAVLNPLAWADHRIHYSPAYSVEWTRWTDGDRKAMQQSEFAAFIENQAPDIVDPPSADMIEISRSMEAKKKVRFASAVRLSDGQTQFVYEEDMQGTVLKGAMTIPEQFKIGIAVFVGGARYAVDCRLRYRITDGRLSMWYEMIRPHLVVEDAVKTMCNLIVAGTACPMYRGELDSRAMPGC